MDRDGYRVGLPAADAPYRVYGWQWILIAITVGALVGRLANQPGSVLRALLTAVAVSAFGILSFSRPIVALQIFMFTFIGGISNFWQGDAYGTVYTGSDIMAGALVGSWLLTGGAARVRKRRFAGWMFGLVVMWLAFTAYGVLRGNLWVFVQRDAVPGLYLVLFFPILDALDDERARRGLIRAAGAGLILMAAGLLYEYVTHLDSGRGIFPTSWGQVYGEEGVAGGPRVTSFAAQWIPAGLLAGLLLMNRRRREAASRAGPFLFTAVATLALLIVYTRSLMASTVMAAVLMGLLLSREPRRALSMAGGVIGLVAFLSIAIPLLGGRSAGQAFDALLDRYSNISQDPSWIDRGHETRAGLEVFADEPFLGAGFGPLVIVPELQDNRRPPSGYFDNAYAGMLAKTGVTGTGLLVTFCLVLATRAVRQSPLGDERYRIALAAGGAWLIGMMIASWSSPFLIEKPGMLYLAVLAALTAAFEAEREAELARRRHAALLAEEEVLLGALDPDEEPPVVPADLWEPRRETRRREAARSGSGRRSKGG